MTYPWRNSPHEPLRDKGAFVCRLEAPENISAEISEVRTAVGDWEAYCDQPMFVGFGHFGGCSPKVAEAAEAAGGTARLRAAAVARARLLGTKSAETPTESAEGSPTTVPPSRAAAKAAAVGLQRRIVNSIATPGVDYASSLAEIVQDRDGVIAASAAEVHCWGVTSLPPALATQLRDHTRVHIEAFN